MQRQLVIKPLVDALFVYLKKMEPTVPASGQLRKAYTYILNQEKYLRVFLEDGEVPIDNNASERAIRGFCIGKKNWQMIDTINGAHSSAIIYSIAETAKANNLKPYDYFVWSYVKKKYKLNVTNFLCSERSLTCYFYCILLDVFKILFLIFIWRQISTMTVNAHGIVKCFDVFKNQFMCMCIIKDFKPVDPFSLQKCMERFYTGVIPWICFL